MQHGLRITLHRLMYAVTLAALFVLIEGMGHAQTLAFSPGSVSLVAGDPDSNATTTPSPASYVGPAAGLVPYRFFFDAKTDQYGNIYVAEQNGNIVRVIASGNGPIPALPSVSPQAGYAYTVAGTGVTDSSGSVTVNPVSSSCTPTTGETDNYGDGCLATEAKAEQGYLQGIAVDSNGNVYITDNNAGLIRLVYAGGATAAQLIKTENPSVTSPQVGYIYAVAGMADQNGYTGDGTLATQAQIGTPSYVAVDSSGNIYFIDNSDYVLRVIYASGNLSTLGITNPTVGDIYTIVGEGSTGASGVPASIFAFSNPEGVAVDSSGNIFVADPGNSQLDVIFVGGSVPGLVSPIPGYVYSIAGGPNSYGKPLFFTPALAGNIGMSLTEPTLDSANDIYINGSTYVYKVDPSGNLTLVFGPAKDATYACISPVDAANDGCAADANTNVTGSITAVALDPQGNFYFPDKSGILHESNVTTSSLYFKSGQTQPIIIYNTGNAALTLTSVQASSQFTIVSLSTLPTGITADCSTAPITLQPGESCETSIEAPTSNTAEAAGTLTVASNATNATNGTNTIQLTVASSLIGTTTALTTNPPNSIPAGTSETLAFTVAASGSASGNYPTGTLTLYSNNAVIATQPVNNPSASAAAYTFSSVLLPTGSNLVYAVYSGDSNYAPSQSTQAQITVNGTATTTDLSVSPTSTTTGQTVTLTATITPAAATGTVTFKSGNTKLGAAVQLNGGSAQLQTTTLPVGTDSITAVYSGDTTYDASISTPTTVNIVQAVNTTTVVTPSATNIPQNTSVTLTATVTAGSGTAAPTGTVQFQSNGTDLGNPVTLTASGSNIYAIAQLTTSSLPQGLDSITAVYGGVPPFNPSNATPITISVGQTPTTTGLTAFPGGITFGQQVTLTASVGAQIGTPSGSVSFSAGSTNLGTATLDNTGTATLTTTLLPGGATTVTDSVTATYQGSPTFAPSTSTTAQSVTVAPLPTTTSTVTASSLSPVYGATVTLTATVAATGLTPIGTVTFYNNGTLALCSAALSTGSGSCQTSSLPQGTDSVTAVYAGGNGFQSSTSTQPLAVVVAASPAATSTALSVTPATPTAGQSVLFTATVTTAGTGTPSGPINFLIGSMTIPSTLGTNGQATFSTSTLTAGIYTVQAVYQGNTGYFGSYSTPATLTVSPALAQSSTTLSLSSSAVQQGSNVTFTATVASASTSATITPTGTVTFYSGTNLLGGPSTLNGGTATYSTTALGAGSYSVTAQYSGDSNFSGSSSTAAALTVAAPTPSFTLSATPTNLTLTSGQNGLAVITLVPTYGYAGTIMLSCGTLPANVTCSFSPATLTADGKNDAVQSTLTISTSGFSTTASAARPAGPGQGGASRLLAALFLPGGLLLWGFASRRKRLGWYLPLLLLGLLTASLVGISGCGGGSGGNTTNAAAGTSTITITGAGSAGSQSQTVNLAVTITQ